MARISVNGKQTTRGKRVQRGTHYLVSTGARPKHFAVTVHALTHRGSRVALISVSEKGVKNGKH